MTSKLTRERIELIANFHRAMTLPPSHDEIEELARMAMAAMDSEPVAEVCEDYAIRYISSGPAPKEGLHPGDKLYRHAQPAPVMPDAYVRDERGRMMLNGVCEPKIGFGAGWNACRAAMLQSGNSPAQSPGWIPVSERMPEGSEEVLCAKEFDGPGDWRKKVGYLLAGKWTVYGASWAPTHWMPLPNSPQEAK